MVSETTANGNGTCENIYSPVLKKKNERKKKISRRNLSDPIARPRRVPTSRIKDKKVVSTFIDIAALYTSNPSLKFISATQDK